MSMQREEISADSMYASAPKINTYQADLDISQEVLDRMPEGSLFVSVKNGVRLPELKEKIENLMQSLKELLVERGAIEKAYISIPPTA